MSTPPTPPTIPKDELTFAIGQKLGHSNQFTIAKLLGRGGFGEVFLANEDRAHRRVAIKTMLPRYNQDKKALRRFKAEYTLGSLLAHPSLVQMFDLCESPEGVHYIVMEFIDGDLLSARMFAQEQAQGQAGLAVALQIGWQIGSLFAQLHARRVIHRDLKPSNIMVAKDSTIHGGERLKLIDFGIAKVLDTEQAQSLHVDMNTTTGNYLGTLPLMSPESFKGGKAQGPEVDVYALGCMLYRAIAGNYPFGGQSNMEVIMQHMTAEPIPLTSEDPLVPHDVADLIHSMLAKDPANRPTMSHVGDFFAGKLGLASTAAGQIVVRGGTQQLQTVLGDLSTGAPIPPTASGSLSIEIADGQSVQGGQILPAPSTMLSHRRRRNLLGATLGVATVLVAGVTALSISKRPGHSAAGSPVLPTPAVPTTPPNLADLGVAVAEPANQPAAAPPERPSELPAHQKKHKKKKGGLLVHE